MGAVIYELNKLMEQVPIDWNPHQKLEFFKVSIRTTMAEAVGRDKGELKRSINEIEENLNGMHKLTTGREEVVPIFKNMIGCCC